MTVFAPNNLAFINVARSLNIDIVPAKQKLDLDSVILLHVLGTAVQSAGISNNQNADSLSPFIINQQNEGTNVLKFNIDITGVKVTAPGSNVTATVILFLLF